MCENEQEIELEMVELRVGANARERIENNLLADNFKRDRELNSVAPSQDSLSPSSVSDCELNCSHLLI